MKIYGEAEVTLSLSTVTAGFFPVRSGVAVEVGLEARLNVKVTSSITCATIQLPSYSGLSIPVSRTGVPTETPCDVLVTTVTTGVAIDADGFEPE